jgi:hypothetical protein
MSSLFDVKLLDLRLNVHSHNGTYYVNFPKEICKKIGIKGNTQQVNIIIHQLIDNNNVINLCTVYKKD